jgi:hypothetical protein
MRDRANRAPAETVERRALAEACQERVGGWLSCEISSPEVLDCVCATSPTREAYSVQVDSSTTASAFDGRLLVARDLTDEQHSVRISLWNDGRSTLAQLEEIYADFLDAVDSALDSGMSLDLAAQTAAAAGHEYGHALSIHHTGH